MIKPDQIIRTRRKTIALIVKPDGSLVVRAPLRASSRQIQQWIEQKASWIEATQEKVRRTYPKVAPKEFVNGEGFLYLGKSYRLQISTSACSPLALEKQFLLSPKALPRAREVFTGWYRQQARQVFAERVAWYAAKYGFRYARIKITSARTRWGSYSSKGTLSFTWRLVMAPVEIIDYVVVHELAHTLEHNHGKAFWEKVKAIVPDYKQKIAWLKINGATLDI
jgi:predicted metal-dependent hydrolase